LTIITFTPLLGAILTLLPWGKWLSLDKAREESLIKRGAIAISLLPLGLCHPALVRLRQGGRRLPVRDQACPGSLPSTSTTTWAPMG
jgi:hypothetical protein